LQVRVGIQGGDEIQGRALCFQSGQGVGRGKGGCRGAELNDAARCLDLGLQGFPQLDGLADQGLKAARIKIHIGEAGENRFAGETVNPVVNNPDLAAGVSHQAQALDGMGQEVFEACHGFIFSADSEHGASGSLGGLFTLVAKHGDSPLV
jgi:hypothetical protein